MMLAPGDASAHGDASGSISTNPAATESEAVDQASVDPGVPSDSLRIVSREPRRMGHSLAPACDQRRTLLCYQYLFGCTLFIVVVLIAVMVSGNDQQVPAEPAAFAARGRSGTTLHICERPGCLLQAAQTVRYLNRSVDPCRDFYGYACGGFSEVHPTGTLHALGVRDVLERRNKVRLLQLLREGQYYNTSTAGATSKARAFFSTCMQAYESGTNNVLTLAGMLKRFGGLDLFGTWTLKSRQTRATFVYPVVKEFNFNDVLLNTTDMHPEQAFFEVRWDRELNLLALGLPKLAMSIVQATTQPGSRAYGFLVDRARQAMRSVLLHLERDSFGCDMPRACNDSCVDEMVEDVIAVQEALVAIHPSGDDSLAPEGVDARLTLPELRRLVPQIDWRRLLDALYGRGVVPDSAVIQVPSTDYMAGVGRIIDDTRYKRLYHFLVWPVIRRYLVALGPVYATLGEQMDRDFGSEDLHTRDDQCLALLEEYMAPALRALLLSAHIGEHNAALVRTLLKEAYGPLVDSFTWMTEDAQRASQALLDSMDVDFGDANSILGPLDDYYSRLRFSAHKRSFLANLNALYSFTPMVKIVQGLPFDKTTPEDVRIRYDIARKTLMIPYGALQVPWYHADIPQHLNAAALGSLIYDELAVPFFLLHISPNLTTTWDQQTDWRLDEFTTCLKDAITRQPISQEYHLVHRLRTSTSQQHYIKTYNMSFDSATATFFMLQGYFTYHLSYRLYRQLKQQEPHTVLPGMYHNRSSQAFYLAYAQARCRNEYAVIEDLFGAEEIAHVPESFTVNELMLGDPSFREAFECGAAPGDSGDQRAGTCSLFKWPTDEASTPSPRATDTV